MSDDLGPARAALAPFGCLLFLVIGLAQMTGCFALMEDRWGWHPILSILAMIFLLILRLEILVCIGCFFGAWLAWGWPWWGAGLLAFPGIALFALSFGGVVAASPFLALKSVFSSSGSFPTLNQSDEELTTRFASLIEHAPPILDASLLPASPMHIRAAFKRYAAYMQHIRHRDPDEFYRRNGESALHASQMLPMRLSDFQHIEPSDRQSVDEVNREWDELSHLLNDPNIDADMKSRLNRMFATITKYRAGGPNSVNSFDSN